jgi:transketolase
MNIFKGISENRTAFGEALVEAGKQYPNMYVLDSDVATSSKTSLFRDAYPDRFFEIGISEANMAGIGAGLSTVSDIVPVISTFACFASRRMLDQVFISIGYTGLNVKINGAYGGIPTGKAGATHQSFEDIAIMRAIPGMVVLVPSDGPETKSAVKSMMEYKGPVYIRTARNKNPVIFDEGEDFIIGKGKILNEGSDIAVISTGIRTQTAYESTKILENDGISVRHIHMPTIKPIDRDLIIKASNDIGKIITIENHNYIGGLGSAVSEVLTDEAPCYLTRLGIKDHYGETGDNEHLFEKFGISVNSLIKSAKEMIKK